MEITPEINELLEKLYNKYRFSGQDMESYMQGLLVSNYEPYWNYVLLDSLLNLQKPKTDFPDELIFITYHQINELFFKLILHEIEQISTAKELEVAFFENRIRRINRYMENLINSFDIMIDGMDREQFLQFRMALLPASGFQSAQFRFIEISLTPLSNLLRNLPAGMEEADTITKMDYAYWAQGATETQTGEKTLTLRQFEKRYNEDFANLADKYNGRTIQERWQTLPDHIKFDEKLIAGLKELDVNIGVNWRLSHFKSAVRYLKSPVGEVQATGGTNWQQYLPPRFQKIILFPEIWQAEEIGEWGKAWVMNAIN